MKKQLMVGLLSAGLVVAMLPGVATAESWECIGEFSEGAGHLFAAHNAVNMEPNRLLRLSIWCGRR
jgi:hypothetical protein